MIVRENDGARVMRERALHHFTWIDAGFLERAAKQFFHRDHAILGIEKYRHEHFVLARAELQAQIIAHRLRRRQRVALLGLLLERTPRHFHHRLQLRIFRRA